MASLRMRRSFAIVCLSLLSSCAGVVSTTIAPGHAAVMTTAASVYQVATNSGESSKQWKA